LAALDRSPAPWPLVDLTLFFFLTQYPYAIPYDPASKCVDGTVRPNLSFVTVALHQRERTVATSDLEAKKVRALPNYWFSFHAAKPLFPMIRFQAGPKQDAALIAACGKSSAAVDKLPFQRLQIVDGLFPNRIRLFRNPLRLYYKPVCDSVRSVGNLKHTIANSTAKLACLASHRGQLDAAITGSAMGTLNVIFLHSSTLA
jgi:hypothetical protein